MIGSKMLALVVWAFVTILPVDQEKIVQFSLVCTSKLLLQIHKASQDSQKSRNWRKVQWVGRTTEESN